MVVGTRDKLGPTFTGDEQKILALADFETWLGLQTEPLLVSSTGVKLPSYQESLSDLGESIQSGSSLGRLASRLVVSPYTGCWTLPKGYRDSKGYVSVYSLATLGLRGVLPDRDSKHGAKLHRLAFDLDLIDKGKKTLTPDMQIEHQCRSVWCCYPEHAEQVNNLENDRLKRLAHIVEKPLFMNQSFFSAYLNGEGFGHYLELLSEGVEIVVSTRFGPYVLIPSLENSDYIIVVKPFDEFAEKYLANPGQNKSVRKSRAKAAVYPFGQSVMF